MYSFHNTVRPVRAATDLRYRIQILLIASERPRYWRFHCMRCGTATGGELSGEILMVTDVAETENTPDFNHLPVAVECRRKNCGLVYEFVTLSEH